jgi:hypothetical protein
MRTEAKQESSSPVCLPLIVGRFFNQTAAKLSSEYGTRVALQNHFSQARNLFGGGN